MKAKKFELLSELAGEPIYSSSEAAKILGCTPQAVTYMVRKGRLKGHKIGKNLGIPESSIKELALG